MNGLPNEKKCVDLKVLLTKILKQAANLLNCCMEIVKEIVYAEHETLEKKLPIYVIVDFWDTYIGKYFFEDDQKKA